MQYASRSLHSPIYSFSGGRQFIRKFLTCLCFLFFFIHFINKYIFTLSLTPAVFSACGSYYRAIIFRLEISLMFFLLEFFFLFIKFYGQMFHMSFFYLFYLSLYIYNIILWVVVWFTKLYYIFLMFIFVLFVYYYVVYLVDHFFWCLTLLLM